MSPAEIMEEKEKWMAAKMEEFGNNGRHLQSSDRQPRRLRSAFDVFDFVSNAVDSGVRKAKQSTEKALKEVAKLDQKASQAVANIDEQSKKVIDTAKEIGDHIVGIAGDVKNVFDKKDKKEASPEPTEHIL